MARVNDRPMVMGTRGAVTAGHWLATAAGQRIAMAGGNAVDAAAAACFCINVLEQHQAATGGECPVLIYSAREKKVFAVSGVGFSPKAFTIDSCRQRGIELIPGDGLLPACVPAVVGTWTAALERFGTMSLAQVIAPAIELAERGFPMYGELRAAVEANAEKFRRAYPGTAAIYLPDGQAPAVGTLVRNPELADTFKALCRAEAGAAHRGRAAGLRAARDTFYAGPIAERIAEFAAGTEVEDATGRANRGLLSFEDMAAWEATIEEPLRLEYRGVEVYKCPSWTQGPVMLQQLALLRGLDLKGMGLHSAEYIHTVLECAKLAFADREAYYGDPSADDVPMDVLLSEGYNAGRRGLVGAASSMELRAGDAGAGVPAWATFDVRGDNRRGMGLGGDGGETTRGGFANDTSHLDVIDAEGNMVSATPSGGWIPSSPVIPGLGFALGTRGQMFYLNAGRPNALGPRKRPRATLTPSLAMRGGRPWAVFGMRGGDLQDQYPLHALLAMVEFGQEVQEAMDGPLFHTMSFPNSFYPRQSEPGSAYLDARIEAAVASDLERRGHRVGRFVGVSNRMGITRDEAGVLRAGVCSTGGYAYGMAW